MQCCFVKHFNKTFEIIDWSHNCKRGRFSTIMAPEANKRSKSYSITVVMHLLCTTSRLTSCEYIYLPVPTMDIHIHIQILTKHVFVQKYLVTFTSPKLGYLVSGVIENENWIQFGLEQITYGTNQRTNQRMSQDFNGNCHSVYCYSLHCRTESILIGPVGMQTNDEIISS